MKQISVCGGLKVSQLALGLMRIDQKSVQEVEELVETALNCGITFFDNADIYGNGKCEELFGQVLSKHEQWRSKMIIQTKCDICQGYYDCSKEHLLKSVEGSLKRMKVNHIDILLLHRPDALINYKEVANVMKQLFSEGKVHYFGVSNFTVYQTKLLQKHLPFKLWFNQIELSIVHCPSIDFGINFNTNSLFANDKSNSILEYCQLKEIQIQAWSILQISLQEGSFIGNYHYQKLNSLLNDLAIKYSTSPYTIACNWILLHPAQIQPICGTTNPLHLKEMCKAFTFTITREEWYELYLSTGKPLP